MEPVDAFERACAEFDSRVHRVRHSQWNLPTPCSEWDVRALVNHLVYEDRWAVPLLEGRTIAEVGDRFEGDLLGDRPVETWEEAAAEALAAVRRPGVVDETVHLSFGDVSGGDYLLELAADHLVHAWDLAHATAADERLDPELVTDVLSWFGPREEGYRDAGAIGPRVGVPDDADPQTRLLAAYGRARDTTSE
jgi:uncharacterized protein (TIGR03086 family)